MRRAVALLGRLVLFLLVLELADVPIICADEWLSPDNPIPADLVVPLTHHGDAALDVATIGVVGADDFDTCFCPCHLNFRPGKGPVLRASGKSAELIAVTSAPTVSAPPHPLDHPPRNLL